MNYEALRQAVTQVLTSSDSILNYTHAFTCCMVLECLADKHPAMGLHTEGEYIRHAGRAFEKDVLAPRMYSAPMLPQTCFITYFFSRQDTDSKEPVKSLAELRREWLRFLLAKIDTDIALALTGNSHA